MQHKAHESKTVRQIIQYTSNCFNSSHDEARKQCTQYTLGSTFTIERWNASIKVEITKLLK